MILDTKVAILINNPENRIATNMITAIPTTVEIMVIMFLPIWKS